MMCLFFVLFCFFVMPKQLAVLWYWNCHKWKNKHEIKGILCCFYISTDPNFNIRILYYSGVNKLWETGRKMQLSRSENLMSNENSKGHKAYMTTTFKVMRFTMLFSKSSWKIITSMARCISFFKWGFLMRIYICLWNSNHLLWVTGPISIEQWRIV